CRPRDKPSGPCAVRRSERQWERAARLPPMAAQPTSDDWNAVPFRRSYVPLPRFARVMCNQRRTYTGNDGNAVSCKTALSTENPLFSTRLQRLSLHLDRHAADVRVHGIAVHKEFRRKHEVARRQLAVD